MAKHSFKAEKVKRGYLKVAAELRLREGIPWDYRCRFTANTVLFEAFIPPVVNGFEVSQELALQLARQWAFCVGEHISSLPIAEAESYGTKNTWHKKVRFINHKTLIVGETEFNCQAFNDGYHSNFGIPIMEYDFTPPDNSDAQPNTIQDRYPNDTFDDLFGNPE